MQDRHAERRFQAIFDRLAELAGRITDLESRVNDLAVRIYARLKEEAEARELR